jgi:O-antigen/teichoic acid export membrane protein
MNIIPSIIRKRLKGQLNLIRVIDNFSWLIIDKILRLGVGIIVTIWLARYLGAEQFGLLSFSIALVSLFGAISSIGLQNIVVRDLVHNPNSKEEILGTAVFLQFIGGFLSYGLLLGFISWLRPDDETAKLIVIILGFAMLFKASEVVSYWFESQVLSKYIVWVQNIGFFIFAAVKITLIIIQAPLVGFAWAVLIETIIIAFLMVGMMGIYGFGPQRLQVTLLRSKDLLSSSWPLLLSSVAIIIYMRVDQIMLGQMLGDEAVGIYSAAVRISEAWFFLLMAIVSSIFPHMSKLYKKNIILFEKFFLKIMRLLNITSLSIGIIIYIFSGFIILSSFGNEYSDAITVLEILCWTGFFVGIGLIRTKYLVLQEKQIFQTIFLSAGALLNIGMNFILIPYSGIDGAAWATFISFAFSVFVFPLVFPSLKRLRYLIYSSILWFK